MTRDGSERRAPGDRVGLDPTFNRSIPEDPIRTNPRLVFISIAGKLAIAALAGFLGGVFVGIWIGGAL